MVPAVVNFSMRLEWLSDPPSSYRRSAIVGRGRVIAVLVVVDQVMVSPTLISIVGGSNELPPSIRTSKCRGGGVGYPFYFLRVVGLRDGKHPNAQYHLQNDQFFHDNNLNYRMARKLQKQ